MVGYIGLDVRRRLQIRRRVEIAEPE
jgi:hypothetical protein